MPRSRRSMIRRPALWLAMSLAIPLAGIPAGPAAAAAPAKAEPAEAAPAKAAPAKAGQQNYERVIVRLADPPAMTGATRSAVPDRAAATQRAQVLARSHAELRRRLAADGIDARVRADYTYVFNGLALQVRASEAARLRSLPGVTAVYRDAPVHATVDSDVSLVGAPAVWRTHDPSGRPDQGAGQIVGVVDTGIDYRHPDLGGGFGPGHKVVAGFDFVNNRPDPMDDNGHGTHVAGIVAGDPAGPAGRWGTAPKASLTAYKVLDQNGNGSESTIIQGLEAAVTPANPYRAGVVNLSLGGQGGSADPLTQACENAAQAGIVVVAAAGNSGPGEGTVSSPANAPDVLAVGASISGIDLPSLALVSPVARRLESFRLGLSANPPARGERLDVVDVAGGDAQDYAGKSVAGKAVLIAYPPVPDFDRVLETARQHQVAAVILRYPDYYGAPSPAATAQPRFAAGPGDQGRLGFVAAVIGGSDGSEIQGMLARGPVRIQVGSADATDQIAAFSSHGPVPDTYALKPDLVAPGVEIHSSWPGGGYQMDSGTSMAAPHVAGAAALLREAHPGWTADQVAAAITGAARPLRGYDATTQGAGRLDVAAADRADLIAAPRVLDLGLAGLPRPIRPAQPTISASGWVTLTNVSTKSVTATLSAGPGAAVSPTRVRLAGGGRVRVHITVHRARPAASADVTGQVRADVSGGGPALTVPYMLAVRPLELHADPDPASGGSRILIHAQPPLAGPPAVTVTAPNGHNVAATATAMLGKPGWWQATAPATAPAGGPAGEQGIYRVAATADVASVGGGSAPIELSGQTTFEEIGPARGDGWQSAGPVSTGADPIALDARPGRMYAVESPSRHAGLFRTDDDGATWREMRALPLGDGLPVGLATDPRRPGIVYLAVNGAYLDPTYQGRLLASSDAGQTWTTLPFPDVDTRTLTVDGDILVVGSLDGNVYISQDRGMTWTPYPSPGGPIGAAQVIGHDLFVAAGNSLYVIRNIDGQPGAPQKVLTAPVSYQQILGVAGDDHYMIAQSYGQVFASRDHGATWQSSFSAPQDDPFIHTVQIVGGDAYATGSSHIWVNRGEAANWTAVPTPVPDDVFTVGRWAARPGELVVSANSHGIYTTTNGGAGYQRVGISGANVLALAVSHGPNGTPLLVAGTENADFSTPVPTQPHIGPGARDWGYNNEEGSIGHSVVSISVSRTDPRQVYQVTRNPFFRFSIQHSSDGGKSWTGLEDARISSRPYAIVDDPADPNRLYVTLDDPLGSGLLVSRDGGKTWRKTGLPGTLSAIAADPAHADRIWLGGPAGLYRSDDGGQTVRRLSGTPVSALAIDPRDPRHLVVGGDALYMSTDGGRTLRAARYTPYRLRVTSIVFAPGGTVYAADGAGTDAGLPVGGRGVLVSADGGRSWSNKSAGLPDLDVACLVLSPDGRWLFAGTEGGGVYRTQAGK